MSLATVRFAGSVVGAASVASVVVLKETAAHGASKAAIIQFR